MAGAVYLIGPPEWEILRSADGTRDLEGIVKAAARAGVPADPLEVSGLLDELCGFGLCTEGAGPAVRMAGEYTTPPGEDDGGREVSSLPGYSLVCDGRGECCRRYASIALTPDDVIRAEHAGLESFGRQPTRGRLTPLRGGDGDDRVTLPLVDGACGELDIEGRCGIHARGGAEAKPVACTSYPRTLVDDGESVRASVACECSCVFTSLSGDTQTPLFTVKVATALPPGLTVRQLGNEVAASSRHVGTRSAYLAWSRRILADGIEGDVIAWLLAQSARLESAEAPFAFTYEAPDPVRDRERLSTELARLRSVSRAATQAADAWRSAADMTRIERRTVAEAIARLDDPAIFERLLVEMARTSDESFFVRAGLFGHAFAGGRPVSEHLVRAAGAILVSRSLGERQEPPPPAPSHPLAMTLAILRGMQG